MPGGNAVAAGGGPGSKYVCACCGRSDDYEDPIVKKAEEAGAACNVATTMMIQLVRQLVRKRDPVVDKSVRATANVFEDVARHFQSQVQFHLNNFHEAEMCSEFLHGLPNQGIRYIHPAYTYGNRDIVECAYQPTAKGHAVASEGTAPTPVTGPGYPDQATVKAMEFSEVVEQLYRRRAKIDRLRSAGLQHTDEVEMGFQSLEMKLHFLEYLSFHKTRHRLIWLQT